MNLKDVWLQNSQAVSKMKMTSSSSSQVKMIQKKMEKKMRNPKLLLQESQPLFKLGGLVSSDSKKRPIVPVSKKS